MLPTVPPFAPDRLQVILAELKSLLHLKITQPPIPMGVIQIVGTILQEHTQRLFLSLSDQGRIDMAAADIGKTPDVAHDLSEEVWPLPGSRKGTDPSRTHSADCPHGGIF